MARMTTREVAQARLVEKAASDPAFRAKLLADARKVIAEEFGTPVPSNVTVEVLEETPTHYYVVLPAASADLADTELDDEALEGVAGGSSTPSENCESGK